MPSPDCSFLAVCGSLRRRSLAKQGFFVLRNLRFYGHGVLRGLLFIQNGYPGVLEQPGLVRVEVYQVLSESVWDILDLYEGYRHLLGERSLFYRKEVTLLRPEIRASVYFLGREIPRGKISIFRHSVDPDSHGYSFGSADTRITQKPKLISKKRNLRRLFRKSG